jgi:hypothetical protein
MCRRAKSQNIEQSRLVVAFPAMLQKPELRGPTVGDGFCSVLRPLPIGAAIERVGQGANFGLGFGVRIKKLRGGQRPCQEESGIDRRQLAAPGAPASLHIQKVVIEAAIPRGVRLGALWAVPEKAERRQGPFHGRAPSHEAPFNAHRITGQCEAGGGNARGPVCFGLIDNKPVDGIGLMEEIAKCFPLQRIQVVVRGGDVHDIKSPRLVATLVSFNVGRAPRLQSLP